MISCVPVIETFELLQSFGGKEEFAYCSFLFENWGRCKHCGGSRTTRNVWQERNFMTVASKKLLNGDCIKNFVGRDIFVGKTYLYIGVF